jgi:hypothetical protein
MSSKESLFIKQRDINFVQQMIRLINIFAQIKYFKQHYKLYFFNKILRTKYFLYKHYNDIFIDFVPKIVM